MMTTDITQYACDRSGRHAYFAADDPKAASDWHTVKHTTVDDVTQQALVCTDCWQAWKQTAARQDTEYNEWLNEGNQA